MESGRTNPDPEEHYIDIIARLLSNSVLEERNSGGTPFLRFVFDPLAEYLSALYLMDDLSSNATKWKTWIAELQDVQGYPDAIKGFLTAMEDCIKTYKEEFNIPDFVLRFFQEINQNSMQSFSKR